MLPFHIPNSCILVLFVIVPCLSLKCYTGPTCGDAKGTEQRCSVNQDVCRKSTITSGNHGNPSLKSCESSNATTPDGERLCPGGKNGCKTITDKKQGYTKDVCCCTTVRCNTASTVFNAQRLITVIVFSMILVL